MITGTPDPLMGPSLSPDSKALRDRHRGVRISRVTVESGAPVSVEDVEPLVGRQVVTVRVGRDDVELWLGNKRMLISMDGRGMKIHVTDVNKDTMSAKQKELATVQKKTDPMQALLKTPRITPAAPTSEGGVLR